MPLPRHAVHVASIPAALQTQVGVAVVSFPPAPSVPHVAVSVLAMVHLATVAQGSQEYVFVCVLRALVYPVAQRVHPRSGRVYPGLQMHVGPEGEHSADDDPGYTQSGPAAIAHDVHVPVAGSRKYPASHDAQSGPTYPGAHDVQLVNRLQPVLQNVHRPSPTASGVQVPCGQVGMEQSAPSKPVLPHRHLFCAGLHRPPLRQ